MDTDIEKRRVLAHHFFDLLSYQVKQQALIPEHSNNRLNTYYHIPFDAGEKIDMLLKERQLIIDGFIWPKIVWNVLCIPGIPPHSEITPLLACATEGTTNKSIVLEANQSSCV